MLKKVLKNIITPSTSASTSRSSSSNDHSPSEAYQADSVAETVNSLLGVPYIPPDTYQPSYFPIFVAIPLWIDNNPGNGRIHYLRSTSPRVLSAAEWKRLPHYLLEKVHAIAVENEEEEKIQASNPDWNRWLQQLAYWVQQKLQPSVAGLLRDCQTEAAAAFSFSPHHLSKVIADFEANKPGKILQLERLENCAALYSPTATLHLSYDWQNKNKLPYLQGGAVPYASLYETEKSPPGLFFSANLVVQDDISRIEKTRLPIHSQLAQTLSDTYEMVGGYWDTIGPKVLNVLYPRLVHHENSADLPVKIVWKVRQFQLQHSAQATTRGAYTQFTGLYKTETLRVTLLGEYDALLFAAFSRLLAPRTATSLHHSPPIFPRIADHPPPPEPSSEYCRQGL